MLKKQCKSPQETYQFARNLGEAAKPGEVYALIGDLGAGKTQFAKGFAAGLGVQEDVTSPTFTILSAFSSGRLPLYHFDVYRVSEFEELFEIGLDDYLYGDGVCLIEWADRFMELLPENTRRVNISFGSEPDAREIELSI